MGDPRDPKLELARVFCRVARALLEQEDAEATLRHIVELAVETLEACEYAGISYMQGRRIRPGPVTDRRASVLDQLQSAVGQGPCFDVIKDHEVFVTGRLSEEERWPSFARRAHAESGVQSVLSVRLFAEQETMGALNLYSTTPDAFDDRAVAIATLFGAHAAVALARSREREQLQRAIASRQAIGQAVGILMAQHGLTPGNAFEWLRAASQRLNRRIETIAEAVVRTGEMPEG